MKDLVVITPDKKWEGTLATILKRNKALGIREVTAEFQTVAGGYDPGVRLYGVQLAASLRGLYRHALLVFDHEGCGDERPSGVVEDSIRGDLYKTWQDNADVVVVEPELEAWLWGASPHIARFFGVGIVKLRQILEEAGYIQDDLGKPRPPKAALEYLFRSNRLPPSRHHYEAIAARASLKTDRCKSDSFHRLVGTLRGWFAP